MKRARENSPKVSYTFHPILESVSRFLQFPDCGKVAQLSKTYDSQAWMYVLNDSKRANNLNGRILGVDIGWIRRYTKHLQHQSIIIYNQHVCDLVQRARCIVYVKSGDAFVTYVDIATIQVRHLGLLGHLAKFDASHLPPSLDSFHVEESLHLLELAPPELRHLRVKFGYSFCHLLPELPHLETLIVGYDSWSNISLSGISEKCPNLKTLGIVGVLENASDLHDLKKINRLVVNNVFTTSVSSLDLTRGTTFPNSVVLPDNAHKCNELWDEILQVKFWSK
jgi:hypothetical protein